RYSVRTRHAASPTRLPYTTLFRSGAAEERPELQAGGRHHRQERVPEGVPEQHPARPHALGAGRPDVVLAEDVEHRVPREAREDRDRKSTRLNSSHVKISYAVFCLK